MEKSILTSTIILMFTTSALYGQQKATFHSFASLSELNSMVLKNNPTQLVNKLNIDRAQTDYKTSKSYLYPSLTGSFSGQDNLKLSKTPVPGALVGKPGQTVFLTFGKSYTYNTGITANWNIFDWQSKTQSSQAKNNIALQEAQADAYNQTLLQQTAQYYYTALIAQAAVDIGIRDKQIADSLVLIAENKWKEGVGDGIAIDQAKINANNAAQNIAQSKILKAQSLNALALLSGSKAGSTIQLTESIFLSSYRDIQSPTSFEKDKNLEIYPLEINNAKLNTHLQKAAFVPKLSANVYLGKQQFRDFLSIAFYNDSWNDYQYLGINLTAPIFTGFANKYKLLSSQKSLLILQQQYADAANQSALNDNLTQKELSERLEIAHASEKNFNLYNNIFNLTGKKYQEGLISLDVYLKTFEDYLKAENAHLNNLSALYNTYSIILSRK